MTLLSFLQCPPIKPSFLHFHSPNSRQLNHTTTISIKPYFFNSSKLPPKFPNSSTKSNSSIPISHDSPVLHCNFPQFPNPNFRTFLQSILPGGTWWHLRDYQPITPPPSSSTPITVVYALRWIWALIAHDKLVVFSAFASLTIAAIAEISIPNLLAVCIFSAQNGENLVFYRSSQLLVMLCLISGVCSGIRGYCFGIANMILVKRLRESLYSVILYQDVSFFDTEAVGTLSSRLSSDCQRLSRVIGNDLHLIFRNILQGGGALLNLLMLSQPLALSALGICFILSAIFLVYGPYQKKVAKVTQELEACANEASRETYSLLNTVRVCGTETDEFRRYQHWLNKLMFVNIRESAAYGLWNLSFATLYRSTQIIAVIFGGLSVVAGQLSSEQLTKYILYCEWLIYATWRLVDSCSSLLQSVGASEKLFQLMDLRPIGQFSCKGFEVQQLRGDIEFVRVSFHYPTRTQIAEISIPNLLAVCIFSAQNGENLVFYRSSQLLVMLCLISGVCSGIRGYCFGIANMILVKRLRESLYSVILYQDVSFFDTEAVGTLSSRLSSDCQRLSRVIGNDLHLIFRNILQGGGALLNLLMLSQPLALSALGICFILSAIFLVYGPYQKKVAKVTQELEACANEASRETYSLLNTVRVCGTETDEFRRYQHWLNKLMFVNIRESAAYGLWNLSFATLYRSTQIIAVIFGGLSVVAGQLSSEQLTKYILYCEWLIYATWRLVDSCSSLLQSVGASEKLFQLMDLRPIGQFSCKGFEVQQLRGDIEFVRVSFHYPTRTQALVVDSVSMHLRANEVIAIVGPSGSGKSTLAKLLLRLYEPADGEILVDGYHLKDVDVKWLRRKIGYVGQEPCLFRMDVKSNITYGCHGDITCEDVEWAAKLAHAHNFILSLPKGYDTLIDDDVLSGGQKQRIAIARAILRNPTILILDEPTSALDTESEQYIIEVLNSLRLQFRKTIIIITHRLSTVTTADRIFVMDGGKIVETGSHTELLQKQGLYARLEGLQRHV